MKTLAFLLALLLAAILIPEAVSISIKTSGCDAGSCFSDSMNIDAPVEATVSGGTTISGGSLAQAISGRGTLHKRYYASSPQGDAASISVDVLMAQSYEYSQPFRTPDEADLSGFSLDASNALAISCDADAVNRDGARANVQTDVIMGSLDGYTSSAQADESGARAVQSAGPASGALVSFSASSSNGADLHSNANTLAAGGSFGSFSSEANSNPQEAQSRQAFSSANGQMISAFSSALTADNLISGQTTVSQGSIASYSSSANSSSSADQVDVVQKMFGAEGGSIQFADTSIGQSVARVSTEVENGNVLFLESRSYLRNMPMGEEGGYIIIPDTWHYASAAGESIAIRSTSGSILYNADSSINIENGYISGYLNEAASHPYAGIAAQIAGGAGGENINLEASSADYMSGSSALAQSDIQGSLQDFYSGTGANILVGETGGIQLSPGSLIAVQRASDFTGNASLSAQAETMDENAISDLTVPPGERSFLQLAGTTQGVYPVAFQMVSPLPDGVPDPFAGFWLP